MGDVKNIFNFLKEFNELSNPVITQISKQKWHYNISGLPRINEIESAFQGDNVDELCFLKIKRPNILDCPVPNEQILEWIDNDWKDISVKDIKVKEQIEKEYINYEGITETMFEKFDDNGQRVESFDRWKINREQWYRDTIEKEKGLRLYNNLFEVYTDIKKESESVELIIGDGNVRWNVDDRVINHPILLQRVELKFNADVPSFSIVCEDRKCDLYMAMLRVIPRINQQLISDLVKDIDCADYDIVDTENTNELFKKLINVIDNSGKHVNEPDTISSNATIHSEPILYLRKRTLGYSNFIESIIENVNNNKKIKVPQFFNIMTGNYDKSTKKEIIEDSWNHSGIDEDVLLTLPANNEQLRIIKYLDRYGAVLVQGPPGTGKTHTIANLIGHLLSEGNNVLVTSHTEKALSVLKDKVYKDENSEEVNLQSLCINLTSSTSQKKEMDEAINEIAQKSSSIDLHSSKSRINLLKGKRKDLINELKDLKEKLIRVRALEYKDIVVDNNNFKPIEAARFIANGKDNYDYIKGDSLNDEIGFPISNEDLIYLYSSSSTITIEEEKLLTEKYPNIEDLLNIADFERITDRILELKKTCKECSMFGYVELQNDNQKLTKQCEGILNSINKFNDFEKAIVNRTIIDTSYRELWTAVLDSIDKIIEKNLEYRQIQLNTNYSIDNSIINRDGLTIIEEISNSEKNKPVGLFAKSKWKAIRDKILVNNNKIELREDFINSAKIIKYEFEKVEVISQMSKLLQGITDLNSYLKEDFEKAISEYRESLTYSLSWYINECEPIIKSIKNTVVIKGENDFGFNKYIDDLDIIKDILNKSNEIVSVSSGSIECKCLEEELYEYENALKEYQDNNRYVAQLLNAVKAANRDDYANALNDLLSLIKKSDGVRKRILLIDKIRKVAPILADDIQKRNGIHGRVEVPNNIEDAWKHFQLRNQIRRLDNVNPRQIQDRINRVNDRLFRNARELAYEKAWFEKIKNQTEEQNSALNAWRNTIKQIGKGTGKRAPMLKQKAKELMPQCQSAIPVWIMPLNRVVENFDPVNNEFDVIIIDEASQANILALAALFLGKKVIIVGDDEQVSPSTVGVKADEVNALVQQHLSAIPYNHLYSGETSLYDMAKTFGFKPLMLTEHFRCLPRIIEFSNMLSYNGKIKPLRDSSSVMINPSVVPYRVPNGSRNDKKVNESEVNHIVSLIQAMIEVDEYEGQTIGVISMLGPEQSRRIESKLQTVIDPVIYEERKIQCGTPPQFQGDERDIIILSLVDSPSVNGGPLRLLSEDGKNDANRKRYNVAASRARNQLWVVHSLNPELDLKPQDIRLKLIKYAMSEDRDDEVLLMKSESPFEKEVMEYLLNKRYDIVPQFKVGAYRIDMIVKYGDKKIALECDGEKFHTDANLRDDLARQAILERLGWRFIRIRGSEYYRNPEKTMRSVEDEVKKNGILPTFNESSVNTIESSKLLNKIKVKANEFRDKEIVDKDFLSEEVIFDLEVVNSEACVSNDVEVKNEEVIGSNIDENENIFITKSEKVEMPNDGLIEPENKSRVTDKKSKKAKNKAIVVGDLQKPKFDFRKK